MVSNNRNLSIPNVEILVSPIFCMVITLLHLINEWKVYKNITKYFYVCPNFLILAVNTCAILNLMGAIFDFVIINIMHTQNSFIHAYLSPIIYLIMSSITLLSRDSISQITYHSICHTLIGVLIILNYFLHSWIIFIHSSKSLRLIILFLKFPYTFLHFWNFYRSHCFNPTYSTKSGMPKPKICNIFYLLAKLFFSWDINIFLRDISKNTLENLVPLPSKLEVHRINEIHVDKKRNVINIWQNLYRIFRARYLCLGFLFFTSTLLMYGQPLVLEQILKNISELNQDNFWLCIIWMSVSVLCNFLTTLTRTHYDYQISILCLEGKSFLLLKIFDLIIINPSYKLSRFSSGEICNLANKDLDKIAGMAVSVHTLLGIFFQLSISFFLLYRQIKLFFLFGVSFCVLLAPINYVIGRKVEIFSKRILSFSDCRIKTLREILAGIVNIRINDWIQPFKNIILTIRNQELKYLSKQKYLDALCVTFWAISPSIVAAISLGFYVYFGNVLTPQKALTSISIFYLLNFPINALSCSINGIIQANVSGKRLQKFLNVSEETIVYGSTEKLETNSNLIEKDIISITDSSFCYDAINCKNYHSKKILQHINVSIKNNGLIGIIGCVGCGKSSLLKSLMGEIHHCSGKILFKRDKKISYAPQNPWLLRGTIRENILRGLEFNENRYKKVIEACCLKYDLENFPEIDRKDVGLRGCKVSGGQRARINLAATIYRNADIYLLDDIFSALDVHVCDEIFDKCILKFLKNKTRLICTNQNKYIDSFDQIFYIENKTVAIKNTEINETISSSSSRLISLSNRSSITIHENEDADEDENIVNISIENKLMSYVSTKNYLKYLNHGPKIGMGILLISILLYTTSKCISDWWLTDYLNTNTQNMTQNNGIGNPLIVFSYFIGAVILFAFIRAFSFSYIFIKICTKIHNHMISLIFTARFYYYENAKIGNIINKFLTDMYAIDETIPFTINIFISLFFNLLGIIALICVSAPIFLCIIPILIPFLIYLQHVYRRTTNAVKRINTICLNPIYESISEAYDNCIIIRVSNLTYWISNRFRNHLNNLIKSSYSMIYILAAFSTILNAFTFILQSFLMIASIISLYYLKTDPGLVGLGITYSLTISSCLFGFLNTFIEMEKNMIHAENIISYINILTDYQQTQKSHTSSILHTNGNISFHDVTLQYEDLTNVFPMGLNFNIGIGTKIGICGRTGSGKSSIAKLLFQIVSCSHGSITIGDINIERFDSSYLSSIMYLITQDSIIFSQSLRFNLDPMGQFSDDQLYQALNKINFSNYFHNISLDDIFEDILNISAGAKQLIILARGFLRKPKILCLDEATSNLDHESEKTLLELVYREFSSSTIINISHRINCLLNCEIIIVLKDGEIVEMDTLENLSNKNSLFSQLTTQ